MAAAPSLLNLLSRQLPPLRLAPAPSRPVVAAAAHRRCCFSALQLHHQPHRCWAAPLANSISGGSCCDEQHPLEPTPPTITTPGAAAPSDGEWSLDAVSHLESGAQDDSEGAAAPAALVKAAVAGRRKAAAASTPKGRPGPAAPPRQGNRATPAKPKGKGGRGGPAPPAGPSKEGPGGGGGIIHPAPLSSSPAAGVVNRHSLGR